MKKRIIECVTNFSEGRNTETIDKLANIISSIDSVKVLHVDPGQATNRTVITFAGEADAVVEAAFQAVKLASELIDMRFQTGSHPRLGATDVLPLIPISGITLEECATLARNLAKRIADELSIPSYCYEEAAFSTYHRNLANCRKGEYEALPQRLVSEDDAPDFGARPFDEIIAKSGAINIGAREILIAVNFNLNTKSKKIAADIAADVRESGRNGVPGKLKSCKAIGWYIDEYEIAQVSMNLTKLSVTPLHIAHHEVCQAALKHGVEVTGTEIIGLLPRQSLIDAGAFYAQQSSLSEDQLIDIAIEKLGLSDLTPFESEKKILEAQLK